jgi:hypothetical protein
MKFDIKHLKDLANKLDYKPDSQQHIDNLSNYCSSDRVIAICEAYAALEARLKAQEPDYIRYDCGACGYDSFRVPYKNTCPECNHRPMAETELFTRAAPFDPRPAVPEGWEACSPEWIGRNGNCSCSEAPRIAFGAVGPHYHPAVFDGGKQKRFVVKMKPSYALREEYPTLALHDLVTAIKAAGGEIAE